MRHSILMIESNATLTRSSKTRYCRKHTIIQTHDDVIKWKHFPRYWPIVRGIHRSPVNSPHEGQWRGALVFSLICVWINDWVNNREAGGLRRYQAHYDVIVIQSQTTLWNQERHRISQCGSLTRYVKLRVEQAPGMPGTFSPPPTSKETAGYRYRHASRHVRDARAVMHVGIANPRWRGKRSRHSRRMRNTQFYVSGKRPMAILAHMYRPILLVLQADIYIILVHPLRNSTFNILLY